MIDTTELRDRAASAWIGAMIGLITATPRGWLSKRGDAFGIVARSSIPALNAAVTLGDDPDLAALDEVAAEVADLALPWSIIASGSATEPVAELAHRYGLTARRPQPMMSCARADAQLRSDDVAARAVRRARAVDRDRYATALTEGFGSPAGAFDSFRDGAILDTPGITAYLAEAGGHDVATGLGLSSGGMIGVFNVAVVRGHRGRGLGRAMTARIMADGFSAGLDTAYLQASPDGRALYESMGFRVVETWTIFSSPA